MRRQPAGAWTEELVLAASANVRLIPNSTSFVAAIGGEAIDAEIRDAGVTSLSAELGRPVTVDDLVRDDLLPGQS